jgi:peptide/nickel transport system substrate-binding protein
MSDTEHPTMLLSRRGFLVTSGAAMAALTLPRAVRAQETDVLRYALSAYPPGLDPFRHEGAAANAVKLQIFRGLLGLDANGQIIGELAESWELEGDTSYTFRIRDNAVFHNGDPVTAHDVAWSLDQITGSGSTAYFVTQLGVISAAIPLDEKTIRIELSAPTPAFLRLLATPYASIISAKSGLSEPVGAGPYKIVSSEQGVSLELEAFEGYYKEGYPKSKKVRMIAYADENLRVAALESGDVDIIEYVPWQAMAKIEGNSNLRLEETTGPNMILVFNVEQPPFNDRRVRQGVAYAINREDIVKTAFYGRGAPLTGLPLDETSPVASEKTEELWSYDPAKAKALFEEAGVAGQTVKLLSSSTYSMHQDTALVVQQHLNAAGLNVELDLPEWGARIAQGNNGQYQFAVNGSSTVVNDPDGVTGMIGSGPANYQRSFGYSNSQLDSLLAEGRHELDEAKRKAAYEAVAEVVREDVPICTLTRRSQGFAMKANITDFPALPGSDSSYNGFALEHAVIG